MEPLRLWLRAFVSAGFARGRAGLRWQPAVRVALDAGEAAALGLIDEAFERLTHRAGVQNVDEATTMQLCLDTAAAIEADNKMMGATPFLDRLQAAVAWLRSLNVPWAKIFANLPAILAALSAGDWAAAIAQLINIFGLPAGTAAPAAP